MQETITFVDDAVTDIVTVDAATDKPGLAVDYNESALIANFLRRPVAISTIPWTGAQTYNQLNPWSSFLLNPAVLSKLANYQYVRGDLHVRAVVNGSPFHYGTLCMWYNPFEDGGNTGPVVNTTPMFRTYWSQRPHAYISPAAGAVEELVIPFVSQRNWFNLSPVGYTGDLEYAQGFNLGLLHVDVFNLLQMANQPAPSDVQVTIYAWMENVELAVPTPYATLQSGTIDTYQSGKEGAKDAKKKSNFTPKAKKKETKPDEYATAGVVSAPATAVAAIAHRLVDAPFIGSFARATEIGATAIAGIASLFGWATPVQLEDTIRVKNEPFAHMATTAGADTVHKLTLDPKNEVFVDPAVVGLGPADSMALSTIFQRESFLTASSWASDDVAGTQIFNLPVTPGLFTDVVGLTVDTLAPTALFWGARPFAYWTGGLVFRLQVVCSQFHRGRIRISYFPSNNAILPAVDLSNTAWNVVVDISETKDFDFVVEWAQPTPWAAFVESDTEAAVAEYLYASNGAFIVEVLNPLSGPQAATAVDVNLYVSAAESFKVAKPNTGPMQNYGTYIPANDVIGKMTTVPPDNGGLATNAWAGTTPLVDVLQSGLVASSASPTASEVITLVPSFGDNNSLPGSHFGEEVVSLRSLVKRSCPYADVPLAFTGPAGEESSVATFTLPAQPYDTLWAKFAASSGLFGLHTFVTWYRTGYACMRGSTRYRVLFAQKDNIGPMNGTSSAYVSLTPEDPLVHVVSTNVNEEFGKLVYGASGLQAYEINTQGGIEFEVPYYYPLNFLPTCIGGSNMFHNLGTDQSAHLSKNSVQVSYTAARSDATAGANVRARVFASAGEDFTLDWFMGAPILYRFNTNGRFSAAP